MTLLKSPDITDHPKLITLLDSQWEKIQVLTAEKEINDQIFSNKETLTPFANVLLCSDYALNYCMANSQIMEAFLTNPDYFNSPQSYASLIKQRIDSISTTSELKKLLRIIRNEALFRIIWRDINQLSTLKETIINLSNLADSVIKITLNWLYEKACEIHGTPIGEHNKQPQKLMVIAMGKYGANELNLSSDIDLIFVYGEEGETNGEKPITNQAFFTRLGQQLINSLDERTADGFVFRVDMRLRPFGQSGALATNLNAFEQYYQEQGRDWERYALIKARIVTAKKSDDAKRLGNVIQAFTYRRYIDFGAIDAMREMKTLINQEANRQRLANNIKTGLGGIREVEFIVQVFQLIYGGQERHLQHPSLFKAYQSLVELNLLPKQAVNELLVAYEFLRNLEHRLQAMDDQQTQTLPVDETTQARIAFSMQHSNWDDLLKALNQTRKIVHKHFQRLIEKSSESQSTQTHELTIWHDIWLNKISQSELISMLSKTCFKPVEQMIEILHGLKTHHTLKHMQAVAKERLDHFMPLLLKSVSSTQNPMVTFQRMIPLIEAIMRRSAYLLVFIENPKALQNYTQLVSISSWFSNYLTKHPNLLHELISTRGFSHVPNRLELEKKLQQQLLCVPEDDLEQQMELMRHFKQTHVTRVAIGEITEQLPLMKASDYLTLTAEAILSQTLNLAWHQLTQKYGHPTLDSQDPDEMNFIIIGYGKLGGIELSFESDLDLVFIYDAPINLATNGQNSIDNQQFFTKLGQRIIHILSTHTLSGTLYDVDMRLRPSGKSGLLVTSLSGFLDYQKTQAWTWEHQALTRARVIAGCHQLNQRFNEIRKTILTTERDTQELKTAIKTMRHKMHKNTEDTQSRADTLLKHERGGIIDIEFIVQYAVLHWAHQHHELTRYTDNIRILETLTSTKCISENAAKELIDAYRFYRLQLHRLTLDLHSEISIKDTLFEKQSIVEQYWLDIIGE